MTVLYAVVILLAVMLLVALFALVRQMRINQGLQRNLELEQADDPFRYSFDRDKAT